MHIDDIQYKVVQMCDFSCLDFEREFDQLNRRPLQYRPTSMLKDIIRH